MNKHVISWVLGVFCTVSSMADEPTEGIKPKFLEQESTDLPVATEDMVIDETPISTGNTSEPFSLQPRRRPVYRYQGPKWTPYAAVEGKVGNNRSLLDGQLFAPLWQSNSAMLFADIRGTMDDSENYEGNWGLGYREIIDRSYILGMYSFYDSRWTENNNRFDQLTVGVEVLDYKLFGLSWDARVNGYLADSNVQTFTAAAVGLPGGPGGPAGTAPPFDPGDPFAEVRGNAIVIITPGGIPGEPGQPGEDGSAGDTTGQAREVAYSGLDYELGMLLHTWGSNQDAELRGFLGGYHFTTDEAGLPDITGVRARMELRMFDIPVLGDDSRVVLGYEFQYDDVREDQHYGIVRVQIPLGGHGRRGRLNPLERRMLDRVVRDVDIVTNTVAPPPNPGEPGTPGTPGTEAEDLVEIALDDATGERLDNVVVVDAEDDVPTEVEDAGENRMVIVNGEEGDITITRSIVLQNGQDFRGAGFDVRSPTTGETATFGERPRILGRNNVVTTIQVADNTTVRDLDVEGGVNGIGSTEDVSNITVQGTSVSNAQFGYLFVGPSGLDADSVIENNVASNNANDGFAFTDNNGTVNNNTGVNNGDNGFEFGDNNGTFTNNMAIGNEDDGFDFIDNTGTFDSNLAARNEDDGFDFVDNDGTFTNNTALGNAENGFVFSVNSDVFTDNVSSGNLIDGFLFDFNDGTFSDNTATNNLVHGFDFFDNDGIFTNNTARESGEEGFLFEDNNNIFTGNTSSDNGDDGFEFEDNNGTFTGNTASNNDDDGFDFDDNNAGGTFSDNVANDNTDNGYDGTNNGTANNNTGSGNGANDTFP